MSTPASPAGTPVGTDVLLGEECDVVGRVAVLVVGVLVRARVLVGVGLGGSADVVGVGRGRVDVRLDVELREVTRVVVDGREVVAAELGVGDAEVVGTVTVGEPAPLLPGVLDGAALFDGAAAVLVGVDGGWPAQVHAANDHTSSTSNGARPPRWRRLVM